MLGVAILISLTTCLSRLAIIKIKDLLNSLKGKVVKEMLNTKWITQKGVGYY